MTQVAEPNIYTTIIGIVILVLIILAVRYILMHGSRKSGRCTGDCGGCGMGCASRFSAPSPPPIP